MKFILEIWPDLGENATPADLVRYAIQSAASHGENLSWDIQGDNGEPIASNVIPAGENDE